MSVLYWIGIVGLGLWTILNVVGAYELFSDGTGRRIRRSSTRYVAGRQSAGAAVGSRQ